MPASVTKVDPVSKLSDRLAKAKKALGLSASQMVTIAEREGYELSDFNAKVYTNGSHPAKPKRSTLEALSFVLRVPLDEVLDLADLPADEGPFVLSDEARLLTAPQRAAVNEIIRLLADGNRGAGHESQQGQSPTQPQHRSTDSIEDGSTPGRPGAPIVNLHDRYPNPETPAPPARGDAAAFEPRHGSEGVRQSEEAEKRGEENQDDQ